MATASLLPRPHPNLCSGHKHFYIKPTFPASFDMRHKLISRYSPSSAMTDSSSSSWEREEQRWLREEQRWLREEQRWIREELRWNSEREALLREIATLRLRLESPDGELPPFAAAVEAVLMTEKERRLLAETNPFPVEEEEVKDKVGEAMRIPEEKGKETLKEIKVRKTLRMGSEGDDVREMQEALLRFGFFSGEDDMEYSSFSSGTECAVKTWQASMGATENGIMTAELLEKLFVEQPLGDSSLNGKTKQRGGLETMERIVDDSNGAAGASVSKIAEVQETVIKEANDAEAETIISQHRVFLLGENRWEEPSRLLNKHVESSTPSPQNQCLACRGEGRVICTECDGSGAPNVEPQFLEWVEEGDRCPYCEGHGYIICDVCKGEDIVQN